MYYNFGLRKLKKNKDELKLINVIYFELIKSTDIHLDPKAESIFSKKRLSFLTSLSGLNECLSTCF